MKQEWNNNPNQINVEGLQDLVHEWITSHGVRYFDPLTNMAMLTEEVGEVARVMARQYGEQSFKDSDKEVNLADELADVMFIIAAIANQTECNLTEAIHRNIEKKTIRDKERHKANAKLQAE